MGDLVMQHKGPFDYHELVFLESDADGASWVCACGHGGRTTDTTRALGAFAEHKHAALDAHDQAGWLA